MTITADHRTEPKGLWRRGAALALLSLMFSCASESSLAHEAAGAPPAADAAAPPAPRRSGIVAAFYEEALRAGRDVLAEGGTATDAFCAITLVDYVRAAGETGIGGPLGAMTYDAETGEVRALDGTFNSMKDPAGRFDPADPKVGAAVLVPGALAGLEALWKAGGRLPWARLVEPARRLAEEGFVVDRLFAAIVAERREVLSRTTYGRELFFPGGEPVAQGQRFRQPAFASFLADVARDGARAMYEGEFADAFVETVNAHGGKATLEDLASYRAEWQTPWRATVRGKTVYANAGRAYGGIYALLGASALAHDPRSPGSISQADRLETRLRMARHLYDDPWFYDASALDDRAGVEARLASTTGLWDAVAQKLPSAARPLKGTHSLHVTVVDADGHAVTGTNTMNSLPWGSGLFVRGVALTSAGDIHQLVQGAGQRVVSPLTLHVVTEGSRLHSMGGAFGSSLLETELQILADVTSGEPLTAEALAGRPRFGGFLFEPGDPFAGNWIDARVPSADVDALSARGLRVEKDPTADVGWGTFVLRGPDGALAGASLDMSWFRGGVVTLPAP